MYTWLEQALEAEYEPVRLLKESPRGSVRLVRHKASGKQFILRRFTGSGEVYQKLLGCTCPNLPNAIKLTRNNQIVAMWEEGYREGTYMGEMRFSAMMGRGKLRSGRQDRSFRSKRGSTSRNQPRKVWQQR